ncbi:hypothetical protein [Ostreiculturibacter nitratireducens]|uniref:hypothetical protein n=1 Tax=Ostreiculturibacter nitratireducens TaxID=3075226 RepID=UPI0031B63FC9
MTTHDRPSIEDVLKRTEALVAASDEELARNATDLGDEFLSMGEAILEAWLEAKGAVPTDATSEGFRLLALHRQAARGNPSFNACRETCREIVYHRNLIHSDPAAPETARRARLGAMVVRHLALFIGGKLESDGLGEFCCSSRGVRQTEQAETQSETA